MKKIFAAILAIAVGLSVSATVSTGHATQTDEEQPQMLEEQVMEDEYKYDVDEGVKSDLDEDAYKYQEEEQDKEASSEAAE